MLVSLVDAYGAAWLEPDPDLRLAALQAIWAADGVFSDPQVRLSGAHALSEHIGTVQAGFPGFGVVNTSIPVVHHDAAYFTWALQGTDGSPLLSGFDVLHATEDAQVSRVTAFYLSTN